jgi:hypothetical protein
VARAEVGSMCPKPCALWPASVTRMIAVSRSASPRVVAQRAPTHWDSAYFAERVGWRTAVRMLGMRAESIGACSSCGAFRPPPGRRPRWHARVEGFCRVFEFELAEEVFRMERAQAVPAALMARNTHMMGVLPECTACAFPLGTGSRVQGLCVANTALRRVRWLIMYGACAFVQTNRN